jgi:cobalamin synthase
MRDHALGTYGAAALALDLLVKVAAVAALLERDDAFFGLVVSFALARAAALPLASALPYPRAEIGPGGVLGGRMSTWSAAGGVGLAAAVAVALLGGRGAAMLAATAAATVLLGVAFRRWLGGVTGDTLGATTELCETLALVIAVATL